MQGVGGQSVFVVHGWDGRVRSAVFDFLGALGLRPMEWNQAVAGLGQGSPYPGDVLDYALEHTSAILILLTPDEFVRPRPELAGEGRDDGGGVQARPNVLFEAGMALAKDPARTIFLEFGAHRTFSDIRGRHLLRMDNSGEKRNDFVNRLRTAGCEPDTSGNHWLDAGDFSPPIVVEPVIPPITQSGADSAGEAPIPAGSHSVDQGGVTVVVQTPSGTGSGSFVARGRVTNDDGAPKTVSVSSTYFNGDGLILGTASGMVNSIGPGQTKTVELISFDDLSSYATYEAQIDNIFYS